MAAHVLGRTGPSLAPRIRVPEGVDASARLAVHGDGYLARVGESLRAAYPAVAHILGDSSFESLAARYLDGLDPEQRNLNYVGFALPGFLSTDPLSNDLPFLADLAQLEWAVLECFHSERAEPADLTGCGHWTLDDWEIARIEFQPGLALVHSQWPICALRDARMLSRSEIDIDLVGHPECALVHRQGFEVVVQAIGRTEARIMARLGQGVSLGEVTADLEADDIGAGNVGGLFTRWTSLGLVIACQGPMKRRSTLEAGCRPQQPADTGECADSLLA